MMAVEAVKEKFYCFWGIVHPTYYQSRGWGPWLVMATFLLIFRGPCEAGEADNSEDEATDEDIDVSIHWRAVGGFGIMYLVFGVVDLGFGNVYAVHCSVYYIRTFKYIDASIY